jgi:hypothetical protein
MKKGIFIFLLLLPVLGRWVTGQPINHWETAVFASDTWKYWTGTSEPDQNWRSQSFNDSFWPEGQGGFGFGDDDDNTIIPQCASVFLRIKFDVNDISQIVSAILNIDYDDAFVAYLNDVEIARAGVQGIHPPYYQLGEDHEAIMYYGEPPESFLLSSNKLKSCLMQGENVLAVQVHNSSEASTDLSSNVWFSFGMSGSSLMYRYPPDWFGPRDEFTSSDLPIVIVTTSAGEDIMDEPKITADMKIINNAGGIVNNVSDPGNVYSGKVGIEIRGRFSASLPQKPYGFETRDDAGNNLNVPILGMPEENDWVLTANYNDKTFLRNFLPFEIFRKMGHYATRSVYSEVVLNDEYKGIYLLGEKIKQDKNRVNIAKLNPDENTGDDVTGGYIFSNDYYDETNSWKSNFSPLNRLDADVYFVYFDPKPADLSVTQKKYLKDYVDSFEKVLYGADFKNRSTGYRAYLDVNSFVDYFILGELSRNVDAYKKSRFYYKDKDSNKGLIHSGPPWDFDWAWKDITENCIHFNQTDGSGWAYRVADCVDWPVPPSWEIRLLHDSDFANRIYERYFALRKTILSQTYLDHVIDSVASLLDQAQQRHYQKWKILGINVGTSEYGEQPDTYAGEILKFKSWISRRLAWLDENMVGEASTIVDTDSLIFRVFPNPVTDNLHIESDELITRISVYNLLGSLIMEETGLSDFSVSLNTSYLDKGLYIIKIYFKSGETVSQRFVKK